jgi:hypothetical protein
MRIVFIGDNPYEHNPIIEVTENDDIQGKLDGVKLHGLNIIVSDIHSKEDCKRLISELELIEHYFLK